MQVRGKTRWCFSVILAFSKSLHESCRLLAFYSAADFFLFTGGLPRFDSTGHGIQFLPQYSFMPQTKKLRISQKHLMRAIFMQNWQLEVIFDSWLKNRYIIWQAWNYISMQLWFRPVLIGIDGFCGVRELQTNDCESWYARWVLQKDYKYMQNPLNFGS